MVSDSLMHAAIAALEESFNGHARGPDRKVGIVLLTFPIGVVGDRRVNYACNGDREMAYVAVKEAVARLEARYFEYNGKQ